VGPRRLSGVVVRPLNFTVRRTVTDTLSMSPDGRVAPVELAGRAERLAAVSIDALIAIILAVAVQAFSGGLELLLKGHALTPQLLLYQALCGWGSFLAINSYFLHKRGQTIGKYFLGVRIVDLQGSIPALWRIILLRYLPFSIVTQFGLLGALVETLDSLLIFRKSRRCLHDIVAGTRVVRA